MEFPTEKNKNGKNKLKIHFEEYKKCRWVLVGIVNGYEQQKTLNERSFCVKLRKQQKRFSLSFTFQFVWFHPQQIYLGL